MSFENTFTEKEIYKIGKHLVEHGEWKRHRGEYATLEIRLPYGADLSSTGSRVDELNKIINRNPKL